MSGWRAIMLACLLALEGWAGSARAAGIPVTIYADDGYPPYSYLDRGRPAGLYYEIVKAVTSRMGGYHVTIRPVPWKRGMALLRSGEGFALYPPYHNIKDEPWTWPYSEPLLDEQVVAYCNPAIVKKQAMRWPEDFYGLRIGNNAGFIVGGEAFEQAVRDRKIAVHEARDSTANIRKLRLGRIDCYINDRQAILWTFKHFQRPGGPDKPLRAGELVEAVTIATFQGHLGYTSRDKGAFKYKDDFVRQFDAIFRMLKKQGEIDRIVAEYTRDKLK
jgi:polar amino acid transport system substrate-binding protein